MMRILDQHLILFALGGLITIILAKVAAHNTIDSFMIYTLIFLVLHKLFK